MLWTFCFMDECILYHVRVATGKNPWPGAHIPPQPSLHQLHRPQRNRPELKDLQSAEHETDNQRQEEQDGLNTVMVTGPSLDPSQEELCSLYFENTKRSGGGEAKSVTWDKERKCFFVTFLDSQGWFLFYHLFDCMICIKCCPLFHFFFSATVQSTQKIEIGMPFIRTGQNTAHFWHIKLLCA